ncbi:hypothetical protein GCM10029976_080420 [Kribbella albertanoniae]
MDTLRIGLVTIASVMELATDGPGIRAVSRQDTDSWLRLKDTAHQLMRIHYDDQFTGAGEARSVVPLQWYPLEGPADERLRL